MTEANEGSFRCPECHTPVELDTPKCPGCGGLFKAGLASLSEKEQRVYQTEHQKAMAAKQQRRSERRQELQDNPFDPRTEVSADAIHIASRIVKHLWIIFVLLPFVAALLLILAGVIK
jgi:hypothetical protein